LDSQAAKKKVKELEADIDYGAPKKKLKQDAGLVSKLAEMNEEDFVSPERLRIKLKTLQAC